MVYGIALVYGSSGTMSYHLIPEGVARIGMPMIFQLGLVLILVGLGFKIASFPFQIWVPDVYQGAPTPSVAFLAIGSKAAGFVLTLRVLFSVAPQTAMNWQTGLCIIAGATILYGNLCAIPQHNIKRLLGYSSIAHAGYLLMGIASISQLGTASLLYYLVAYLFSVLAAFAVLTAVAGPDGNDNIGAVAGLHERSPLLALILTMSMVSLAGIPPLAGFMGKFLLLKAALKSGAANAACYWLISAAIVGIMASIYYYFGVIRAMFWSKTQTATSVIEISWPAKIALFTCLGGMLFLGIFPSPLFSAAETAVKIFNIQ
jgi:NADH-quinone oxidoreductase subunit N